MAGVTELAEQAGGSWGWWGGGAAVLIWTAIRLRSYLSSDGVERHKDGAEKDLIESLSEQLEKATQRAERADARTDAAYHERNLAIREIAKLGAVMATMEERQRVQGETILSQRAEIEALRSEVRQLTEQLNVRPAA